jgi:hypothetical protein
MVNKTDFTPPSGALSEVASFQDLMARYQLGIFASLGQLGESDVSLPAKIAQQLLGKDAVQNPAQTVSESIAQSNFPNRLKLDHLVTLLPTFKDLPPEFMKMLEAAVKKGDTDPNAAKDPLNPERQGPTALSKPESPGQKNGGLESSLSHRMKATESAPLPSAAILSTIKEVLTLLYYFTSQVATAKPGSLENFEKIMKPLVDQLILPIKKGSESEFESKNREIPSHEVASKEVFREKNFPLPMGQSQTSEKHLTEHRVDQRPSHPEKAPPIYLARKDEASQNLLSNGKRAETQPTTVLPPAISQPGERTSIPGAPFTPQNELSTAPQKKKKKQQDPHDEGEEDPFQEDEDPFR